MKILKWIINIILITMIIYYLWPVGEKTVQSVENKITYNQVREEKENKEVEEKVEETGEVKQIREYDWIKIPGTNIDYPIAWKERDNSYYLNHNINGKETPHGSIFYDGSNEPYSKHTTVLYGHCMRDKSMFATLHYFREDEQKFRDSELIIERKDGTVRKYKPLGVYVTNSNFFYNELEDMTINDAIKKVQEHSKYDIDVDYNEQSEIIVLMTCSYEHEGDRLFVFYISE